MSGWEVRGCGSPSLALRLRRPWGLCGIYSVFEGALSLHAALPEYLSVRFCSQLLWWLRTIMFVVHCPHWRLLHLRSYVHSCSFLFCCVFLWSHRRRIFEFLFSASENSLRFQTLLVAGNAPCGVSLVCFVCLFSAAIKCCSGSVSWDLHRCRCTLYRILPFERLGMSWVWLVGWLAATPLLSLTHDVSTVNCLLLGLQMSMYSESRGRWHIVHAFAWNTKSLVSFPVLFLSILCDHTSLVTLLLVWAARLGTVGYGQCLDGCPTANVWCCWWSATSPSGLFIVAGMQRQVILSLIPRVLKLLIIFSGFGGPGSFRSLWSRPTAPYYLQFFGLSC